MNCRLISLALLIITSALNAADRGDSKQRDTLARTAADHGDSKQSAAKKEAQVEAQRELHAMLAGAFAQTNNGSEKSMSLRAAALPKELQADIGEFAGTKIFIQNMDALIPALMYWHTSDEVTGKRSLLRTIDSAKNWCLFSTGPRCQVSKKGHFYAHGSAIIHPAALAAFRTERDSFLAYRPGEKASVIFNVHPKQLQRLETGLTQEQLLFIISLYQQREAQINTARRTIFSRIEGERAAQAKRLLAGEDVSQEQDLQSLPIDQLMDHDHKQLDAAENITFNEQQLKQLDSLPRDIRVNLELNYAGRYRAGEEGHTVTIYEDGDDQEPVIVD